MDAELTGRQPEDQPAVARIDARDTEDVAEKRARRACILGVDERVCTRDHGRGG
jgi:hypothetical protein